MSELMARSLGRQVSTPGVRWVRRIVFVVVLLVAWQVGAGLLPHGLFPTPVAVVQNGVQLVASGELPEDFLDSLGRVAIGYLIAAALGTLLGAAMGTSRRIDGWLHPVVELFRPVSPAALVPLAALWLGTGNLAPIAIVAYAAVFPVVLNAAQGVRQVEPTLVAAVRTLGVGRLATLLQVALPGSVPQLLVGLRLAAGNAWRAVILAELLAGAQASETSSGGLGILMYDLYAYRIDLPGVIACIVFAGVVGIAIDHGLRAADRAIAAWAPQDGV